MIEAVTTGDTKPAPAPATPAPADTTAVPAGEAPKPETQPERTFTQKELDEIVERRVAKERRKREELKTRLKVTEELALRSKPADQSQRKQQPSNDDEPKREAFDTYEAFIEARAEWRADRKVTERLTKDREEQDRNRTATETQKRAEDAKKRVQELAKPFEDFEEVMEAATSSPEAPVSRLLMDPVIECDNPAAVLYHLAKNEQEAERIASLPAQKQAREIWALDAKLKSAPAPKKPSNAPEPIKPVGGKPVTGDEMPEVKLADGRVNPEWLKWRQRQEAAARKG